MFEHKFIPIDEQQELENDGIASGYYAAQARRAEQQQARLDAVMVSVVTRSGRSPEESAARMAELQRRIDALPSD